MNYVLSRQADQRGLRCRRRAEPGGNRLTRPQNPYLAYHDCYAARPDTTGGSWCPSLSWEQAGRA